MRFDEASAWYAEFGPFYTGLQFSAEELPRFLEGEVPRAPRPLERRRPCRPRSAPTSPTTPRSTARPATRPATTWRCPSSCSPCSPCWRGCRSFDVGGFTVTLAEVVIVLVTVYYLTLDPPLALLMLAASALFAWVGRVAARGRSRSACSSAAGCCSSSATTSTSTARRRSSGTSPTCWSVRSGSWPRPPGGPDPRDTEDMTRAPALPSRSRWPCSPAAAARLHRPHAAALGSPTAICAGGAGGGHAGAHDRPRGLRSQQPGRPADARPATAPRLFVVEQRGPHPHPPRRRPGAPRRSSTSSTASAAGASAACSASPSIPRYAQNGRFFVNYTDRAGDTHIAEFRAPPAAPTRRTRPASGSSSSSRQPFANHNGGGLAFGPDGMLYIGARRRRLGRRPAGQRAEPGHAARQDAAHRRRPRHALRRPRRQPVRGARPGARPRSGPTACATPGASRSTARPATSTSATSARTRSRRSTSASPRGAGARTTAGTSWRARAASARHAAAPPRGLTLPVRRIRPRRRLLDHRRRRLPRLPHARLRGARTSTATSARA